MRLGSILVTSAGTLTTGDLFAFECAGVVWSGKVSALVYSSFELTPDQTIYMVEHELEIPTQGRPIAGDHSSVLFYIDDNQHKHVYVEHDMNVAVFLEAPKEPS